MYLVRIIIFFVVLLSLFVGVLHFLLHWEFAEIITLLGIGFVFILASIWGYKVLYSE